MVDMLLVWFAVTKDPTGHWAEALICIQQKSFFNSFGDHKLIFFLIHHLFKIQVKIGG